jgi:hypothetical protein
MRIPQRIALTTKLALVCLLAAAALAQASSFRSYSDEGTATTGKAGAFKVRGHLSGLYPGRTTVLKARVTNTGRSPIVVTRLTVAVRSTTAGCLSSTVKIKPFAGRARVNGHASIKLPLAASMQSSTPDACQGSRYQLTFKGKAVGA